MLKAQTYFIIFQQITIKIKNHFVLLGTICTFALPKKYKT
jgi:hypothetical protein